MGVDGTASPREGPPLPREGAGLGLSEESGGPHVPKGQAEALGKGLWKGVLLASLSFLRASQPHACIVACV